MRRISAISFILLLAFFSARSFASKPSSEDPDGFFSWEPTYSTPLGEPDEVNATISLHEAAAEKEFLILGASEIDAESICNFIWRHNPDFPKEIAEIYLTLGDVYGIRGDVAICQAIIETGWFKFADGTAVTLDQNNYCGLGVTRRGVKGASFDTIDDGVRAHLQHLYAYASTKKLPNGEPLLDPRFGLVMRGLAHTWHDLSNRWAMNPNYGNQIADLYNRLVKYSSSTQ